MKDLQLSLIKKWFYLTKSGEKPEDYRELTLYWFKRLVFDSKKAIKYLNIKNDTDVKNVCLDAFWSSTFAFKPFKNNIMTLGYPKSTDLEKIATFEHNGIEINTGRAEWGAEKEAYYFVIKHGRKI